MGILDDMEMLVKSDVGVAFLIVALIITVQPNKEISRKARYTLDLGAANPLRSRTEGD